MTTDRRVTYRRHHSYATRSNVVRKLRTPGGKVTVQYVTKKANPVKCGDTGVPLQGIPRLRPTGYARIPKHDRSVTRAYGGCLSAKAVRERIMRAFIIEEQKIVKRVLQEKMKAAKTA